MSDEWTNEEEWMKRVNKLGYFSHQESQFGIEMLFNNFLYRVICIDFEYHIKLVCSIYIELSKL